MSKKGFAYAVEQVIAKDSRPFYRSSFQTILVATLILLMASCSAEQTSGGETTHQVENKNSGSAASGGYSIAPGGQSGSVDDPLRQNGSGTGSNPVGDAFTPEATCSVECPECTIDKTGVGTDHPFDLSNPSRLITQDQQGALVIQGTAGVHFNRYLWVADTDLPGVLKIDLNTLQVVARYLTPGMSTSRTTVNALGEAFVGCRGAAGIVPIGGGFTGVAKFYPDGPNCPDTNGDGVVTTSTGPDDVLPVGQDDCLGWYTELPGDIRGLAAQDIPGTKTDRTTCEGYNPDTSEFDIEEDLPEDEPDQHYLWGGGVHATMYKLDAATGDVLLSIPLPIGDYGAALSGDGKLYFTAGVYGAGLGYIDTMNCLKNNCPIELVSQTIPIPSAYGITVDCKQRVWISNGPTKRYDPSAPAGMMLTEGPTSGMGGIAADAQGWVWACNFLMAAGDLVRIDAETMESIVIPVLCKGVAVDSDGRVFAIGSTPNAQMNMAPSIVNISMIEPGPTLQDYTLTTNAITLSGFAYAYSDMTGVQTRLASNEPGWYRQTFEHGCGAVKTEWRNLKWEVEVPEGAWVMFKARAAESPQELAVAPWHTVACLTSERSGSGCAYIGQRRGNYLEIEARFAAPREANDTNKGCSFKMGESARVLGFSVSRECGVIIK